MELRGTILVKGLNVETDIAGEFLDVLNQTHGDLGPVLSGGGGDDTEVILATDQPTEANAAQELLAVVREGLVSVGLNELEPGRIEFELVE